MRMMEVILSIATMHYKCERSMNMNTEKEKIYRILDEIRDLIQNNENTDGSFQFDVVRVLVALDFVKTEILKSISR